MLWKIFFRYGQGLDLYGSTMLMCSHTSKMKIVINADDLVSVPQAAKEMGVHFATVYRWIKKGKLRALTVGRQDFLTRDMLEALKKGGNENNKRRE